MEFGEPTSIWKGDTCIGASVVNSKDGRQAVLVTTPKSVVEISTFNRSKLKEFVYQSPLSLCLPAVKAPVSCIYFGVRGQLKINSKQGTNRVSKVKGAKIDQSNHTDTNGTTHGSYQQLVTWKESEKDAEKWKTTPLNENTAVYNLYTHPQLSTEAIVLYENGKLVCFDDSLSSIWSIDVQQEKYSNEKRVVNVSWASLASNHRNPLKGEVMFSLVLCTVRDKTKLYELVVVKIPSKVSNQSDEPPALVLRLPIDDETDGQGDITAGAFHGEELAISLVWSSGMSTVFAFHQNASESTWTGVSKKSMNFTTNGASDTQKKRKLHENSNVDNSKNVKQSIVACSVGQLGYLVAIDSSAPSSVHGYDVGYAMHIASCQVTEKTKQRHSQMGNGHINHGGKNGALINVLSFHTSEFLIVVYEHAIWMIEVTPKVSSLANVLGGHCQSGNLHYELKAAPHYLDNKIDWLEVATVASVKSMDRDAWSNTFCQVDIKERSILSALMECNTPIDFKAKWDKSVPTLQSMSHRFIFLMATHCIQHADSLKPWVALEALMKTQRLTTQEVPTLIPCLMKHQQFGLLELALSHILSIDEKSIVMLIQYYLKHSDSSDLIEYIATKGKQDHVSPAKKRKLKDVQSEDRLACEPFIRTLISLPTNNVFLLQALQRMNVDLILLLLTLCKKWVIECMNTPVKELKGRTPPMKDLCTWISAVLDCHFASLVLAANRNDSVRDLIMELDSIVQLHISSSCHYESVHCILENFLNGVKLPKVHGIPEYSIENLPLPPKV